MPIPVSEVAAPRQLVRDRVFDRLFELILDGELVPGEQLYNEELEAWLGVSATPVREALNRLALTGLVEIQPQKNTCVAPIDPARLDQVLATVVIVLQGIVRDTTPLLTTVDKTVLRGLLTRAEVAGEGTARERDGILVDLVDVFVRRLDNAVAARILARLLPELRRALIIAATPAPHRNSLPALRLLVAATTATEPAAAAVAIATYWNEGIRTVLDAFTTVTDPAPVAGETA
ncbi:GntR family transcriptional regulator [Leifsonia aquatica]|uniref:GntR family transcriptional regulator n=1 Tax=Leifsonia aquatica TaxID=144185 RepID=UPI00385137E8